MHTSIALDSSRKHSEDRGEIIWLPDGLCLAVADGAGGISGGAEAADMFINAVKDSAASFTSKAGCAGLFMGLDSSIEKNPLAGETTGVLVLIRQQKLFGASAGDSAAWLFSGTSRSELTQGQARKPLLGAGSVMPHIFSAEAPSGMLVIATDGLWKYTSIDAIHSVVRENGSSGLASKLIELVRLKSGELPDDTCVITCTVP